MKSESKLTRFLNGKGFYATLGICLIAVGVSAWTTLSSGSKGPDTAVESSTSSGLIQKVSSDVPVDKPAEDVPADSSTPIPSNDEETQPLNPSESTPQTETATPVAKYFIYPVVGEIIKGFSEEELQYSLTYNDLRLHTGIDIKASVGTAVKAAGEGVVLSTVKDPNWGTTVTINHGNGITAVYAGLADKVTVKKGDIVKAGTVLGPLSTIPCESVDAPHLHLEFYQKNKPINPKSRLTTN